jgi:hypothetical protein
MAAKEATTSVVLPQVVRGADLERRAVLYSRVSTNNGQGPEMQSREIREYCLRRGWPLVGEYVDRGISGAKERRWCLLVEPASSSPLLSELTETFAFRVAVVLPLSGEAIIKSETGFSSASWPVSRTVCTTSTANSIPINLSAIFRFLPRIWRFRVVATWGATLRWRKDSLDGQDRNYRSEVLPGSSGGDAALQFRLTPAIRNVSFAVKSCRQPCAFERQIAVKDLRGIEKQDVSRPEADSKAPSRQNELAAGERAHGHEGCHYPLQVARIEVVRRPEIPCEIDS